MQVIAQNRVCEWSYAASGAGLFAMVHAPDGTMQKVPAFKGGDGRLHLRFSAAACGVYQATLGWEDGSMHYPTGETEKIEVIAYRGENPLYLHGAPTRRNNRYLEHADGTPFFYLADTWWMGFTKRLPYPDGITELAADRQKKGFTAVQIVAGLYPDMPWGDIRGENEAGLPWDKDFSAINPAYFDEADKKITLIVERGMVPVIVGSWGFFAPLAGLDVLKQHWDMILARWAAYPVIFCLAGEASMPFYGAQVDREAYFAQSKRDWTELARYVRAQDPFRRCITIHAPDLGHIQLEDESLLDLDMLQTGHSAYRSLAHSVRSVKACAERNAMPVINSEACYEGICGASFADIQRYLFLGCVLSGACGHTYGANGIWQCNAPGEPYGVSPHGATWGNTPWTEAYRLPGSSHIGNAKRFLCQLDWWRLEQHPEWVERPCSYEEPDGLFSCGILGELRVIFNPNYGGEQWGQLRVLQLEPDTFYHAYYFDMIVNSLRDLGTAQADSNGGWLAPRVNILQDWILVLSKTELTI